MLQLRKSEERGHFDFGWLNTYHTFSFSDYYDRNYMGFRQLRVINQDRVQPGEGFGTHPHRDMEIISYVLEGGLEHRDSMGNGSVIRPGDVQRMSAGTGVTHSEFNHSKDEVVHFLQIWLLPEKRGITPSYEQKYFSEADKLNKLVLVASPEGRDGSVKINTNASLYATILEEGRSLEHQVAEDRYGWVQVARGEILVNGQRLKEGDGLAVSSGEKLSLLGQQKADVLVFDLA